MARYKTANDGATEARQRARRIIGTVKRKQLKKYESAAVLVRMVIAETCALAEERISTMDERASAKPGGLGKPFKGTLRKSAKKRPAGSRA